MKQQIPGLETHKELYACTELGYELLYEVPGIEKAGVEIAVVVGQKNPASVSCFPCRGKIPGKDGKFAYELAQNAVCLPGRHIIRLGKVHEDLDVSVDGLQGEQKNDVGRIEILGPLLAVQLVFLQLGGTKDDNVADVAHKTADCRACPKAHERGHKGFHEMELLALAHETGNFQCRVPGHLDCILFEKNLHDRTHAVHVAHGRPRHQQIDLGFGILMCHVARLHGITGRVFRHNGDIAAMLVPQSNSHVDGSRLFGA